MSLTPSSHLPAPRKTTLNLCEWVEVVCVSCSVHSRRSSPLQQQPLVCFGAGAVALGLHCKACTGSSEAAAVHGLRSWLKASLQRFSCSDVHLPDSGLLLLVTAAETAGLTRRAKLAASLPMLSSPTCGVLDESSANLLDTGLRVSPYCLHFDGLTSPEISLDFHRETWACTDIYTLWRDKTPSGQNQLQLQVANQASLLLNNFGTAVLRTGNPI
jgi:hypothetical protein